MTNRVNLLCCQIAYLHFVKNYEKPENTHWHYVKPRRRMVYFSSEKYEQPYWFPIYKITSGCSFYSYQSKRKVSDSTLQKFFSQVSCRLVFLRLRWNKRKNHCLTDATLSYECEPSACKMKIFVYPT